MRIFVIIIYALLISCNLFGQLPNNYPKDGLTYNEYIGENISGSYLANGWRTDTVNGGYHKDAGENPFLNYSSSSWPKQKHGSSNYTFFRYSSGKRYTGDIKDTLSNGIIFQAPCFNGLVQGKGTFYYADGSKLSEGSILNGEMIGDWCYYYPEKYLSHRVLYLKNNGSPILWIEYRKNGEIIGCHKLQ